MRSDLRDIEVFLSNADKVLYMAEFFSECIKQIRKRLGHTDQELQDLFLDCLSEETQKCVLDNSFGIVNSDFVLRKPLNWNLTNYFELLNQHFECSSMKEIRLFRLTKPSRSHPLQDSDLEYLAASLAPNLTIVELYIFEVSDKGIKALCEKCSQLQMLELYGCLMLTNESFKIISTLNKLHTLIAMTVPQLTDEGVISLENTKLKSLMFYDDIQLTDLALLHLPQLEVFSSDSTGFTTKGVGQFVKKTNTLTSIYLNKSNMDDQIVAEILQSCSNIITISLESSKLSEECLLAVPVPQSLKRMMVASGVSIKVPPESACQIINAKN